jgi:hypothetical protein
MLALFRKPHREPRPTHLESKVLDHTIALPTVRIVIHSPSDSRSVQLSFPFQSSSPASAARRQSAILGVSKLFRDLFDWPHIRAMIRSDLRTRLRLNGEFELKEEFRTPRHRRSDRLHRGRDERRCEL